MYSTHTHINGYHAHNHTHIGDGERDTSILAARIGVRDVCYGVALVSRIDTIIGLFCKRDLQKRQYSAKETYNLIDLTNRSHPIMCVCVMYV